MPAQRVGAFTESVIREMTRLCESVGGINLAQGFPDFPAPQVIKEAAVQAIRDDENQYAITWGEASLRPSPARWPATTMCRATRRRTSPSPAAPPRR